MAYNEQLRPLYGRHSGQRALIGKKKFGWLAYLSNEKMFAGILGSYLVVRVGPDVNDEALKKSHTKPMDFTGIR